MPLFLFLFSFLLSWGVVFGALLAGKRFSHSEHSQHHHTHEGVIPRLGGLGIIVGFTAAYLVCFFFFDERDNQSLIHYSIFGGGFAAFLLGFVDDIHPLGAKLKLMAQIIIALLVHHAGIRFDSFFIPFTDARVELGVFGIFVTVFWFVALMNLINLIDGLDGLAGGIGLMLMSLLAYLAYSNGIAYSLLLSLGMCGAILGFLFHNFPPAKVYMGDSGAYLIGFVIASISLLNSEKGSVLAALIAPVIALSLPICDVAFAIVRRFIKGLPLFRPDRRHIHHRLAARGLSRRKTVLFLYAFSLLALLAGLLAFVSQGRMLPILLGVLFVVFLLLVRGRKITFRGVGQALGESLETRQDTKNAIQLRDWLALEAIRADTGEHLWSDFCFVLRKAGFCRAELRIGHVERSFYLPNSPHDQPELLWHEAHRISADTQLIVYAGKDSFSEKQFAVISDIVAEAWNRAGVQWQRVNGNRLSFEAAAREPQDYREQKSRSLYRPTY